MSLQIGKTALVGINYLNFAVKNRKNSHLEIYRPLRNALIHSINLVHTAVETLDCLTLPQGGGYGYGSKGSYGSGGSGSGGYAGGSSVSKPDTSGCKGDQNCIHIITAGSRLTLIDDQIDNDVRKSWARAVFEIQDGFALRDCKKAYNRLSLKFHEDKCTDDMKQICQTVLFPIVGGCV